MEVLTIRIYEIHKERDSIGREEKRQNARITWFGPEANIHKIPLLAHHTESNDTMNPNGVYIGG